MDPLTEAQRQNIERYKNNPAYRKQIDSKFFTQRNQSTESPLSGGAWIEFDDSDIEVKKNCAGPGSNGYFLLWLCPLLFIIAALLTSP